MYNAYEGDFIMKNILSKKLFGIPYDELPLASEIIIDLKMKLLKWKFLSIAVVVVFILTAIVMCGIVR